MNRLIIIGASGHGKVVADIAKKCGYKDIVFLDDSPFVTKCGEYKVIGNSNTSIDGDVFVAIGNAEIRKRLSVGRNIVSLIHPDAIIADDVEIGLGTVVMAGVVINPGVRIGKGCIINTSSSIDHDCYIGDYNHISVGTHLCGTVITRDDVWIGAGATVINNISICEECIIGAGAVVIKDINISGVYVGVPAKPLDKKDYKC